MHCMAARAYGGHGSFTDKLFEFHTLNFKGFSVLNVAQMRFNVVIIQAK